MHITSKSRYAMKVMLDVAKYAQEGVVRRKEISVRQGVPLEYLDQILLRLRRAGLLASSRGPLGGYQLAKKEASVSAWDIFAAVEDSLYPVSCVNPHTQCHHQGGCDAQSAWGKVFQAMYKPLSQLSLADLKDQDMPAAEMSNFRTQPSPPDVVCCGGGH